jgi:3-oxoacyl-[acyl-carrier protein] reductase
MVELNGKVALVTGGSRGIGAAISRRLAEGGADVAFTYFRDESQGKAVVGAIEATGRRCWARQLDAANASGVQQIVDGVVSHFGRLDILVNNAGIFPSGPLEDVTVEEVDRTLAVHVRAVFLASQAAARHMRDGGRIISIGSCFAERVPYAGVSLYAMSKAALLGLTKGLARDLGPRGVTVTLVHPGSTDTDMNPANGPTADYERTFIALGRYARPEDVAETVAFLASPQARYITGTSVAVDGGFAA